GDTAWDPASRTLVSWNMNNGADLYRITDEILFMNTFAVRETSARENHLIGVAFAQEAKTVVHGSANGQVYVWSTQTREKLQVLSHGHGSRLVQAITTVSPNEHFHLIASGTSTPDDNKPTVKIWSTQPQVR
ncbi:hypothetical protein OF83DRAFT_1057568, partial [Amylostereum chailletii]